MGQRPACLRDLDVERQHREHFEMSQMVAVKSHALPQHGNSLAWQECDSGYFPTSNKTNKINILNGVLAPVGRRPSPRGAHKLLKMLRFMCLGILLRCTVCCTWRACLRGIAISARSSRTIKIIQWSGRRSPFDEHGSLPVRGRQVLDGRVAEKAYSTARSNWCRCSYRGHGWCTSASRLRTL